VTNLIDEFNSDPVTAGNDMRRSQKAEGTAQAVGYGTCIGSSDNYDIHAALHGHTQPIPGGSADTTAYQPQGYFLGVLDGPAAGRM
jgi:hypothetical protein